MRSLRNSVIRNASANVLRGGAGAIVALLLPPLLTRSLNQDHFAAWSLLLQIAAYTNFLDAGFQTAVSRFIAHKTSAEDGNMGQTHNSTIATSLSLFSYAGIAVFLLLIAFLFFLGPLLGKSSGAPLSELRAAICLLAFGSLLQLPLNTFGGVLLGLQRNDLAAITVGGGRVLGALAIVAFLPLHPSLITMTALLVGCNLLASIVQYYLVRWLLPSLHIHFSHALKPMRSMFWFCAGLSLWSLTNLLVTGLDLTVIAHFAFNGVAQYSIAANLVMVVSGLVGAATSALVAPIAALEGRGEHERIVSFILRATGLTAQLLVVCSTVLFLLGPWLLNLWVGPAYAIQSYPILKVLLAANVIRLLAGPYSAALIGAGQHRRIIAAPIAEGLINLAVSIAACARFGPIGVAWGTFAGGMVGVFWHIAFNISRSSVAALPRNIFLYKAIMLPLLPIVPLVIGAAIALHFSRWRLATRSVLLLPGTLVLIWLASKWRRSIALTAN